MNSFSSKFDDLKMFISEMFDIFIIKETKLDDAHPHSHFHIEAYSMLYRLNRNRNGREVMIYVREDIPNKFLRIFISE